ncbi:hypothetical protein Sjap_009293 [Stephania japonica]|uniref:Uncharacterized protein n=1 Tax=Stephania japonica TaxID=461633 RepID=A0AAP0PD61_9MAGN
MTKYGNQIHGLTSSSSTDHEPRGNLVSAPLFSKDQLELLQSLISQSQQASQNPPANGNALMIKGA